MKVYLDCFPCFMRQALDAARMATDNPAVQRDVLDRVAELLPTVPFQSTPIDIGQLVHRVVMEVTGVTDPYAKVKKDSNDLGLKLYPRLKKRVRISEDPLLTALKIAGAGNIIDFGPKLTLDPNGSIEQIVNDSFTRALQEPLDSAQYLAFKEELAVANEILYLGDNTGEIVCDRILIEELVQRGKKVTFVTRGAPTINDATLADARYVGLDNMTAVIANGSDAPGTRLVDCSPEFTAAFQSARLIISKGQGNFEGLSDVLAPIFFLFKVKCPVIAQETEAEIGEVVLREQTTKKVTK
ncbi:MAG: ARMT1-like domain-containing protein [Candidatus Bipolaricaulota bacterium]|nr:ARMT1-like domain-containing protein [Candidatus Bipolaricaulota bacterium]